MSPARPTSNETASRHAARPALTASLPVCLPVSQGLEKLERRDQRQALANPAWEELMADFRSMLPEGVRVWWNNRKVVVEEPPPPASLPVAGLDLARLK